MSVSSISKNNIISEVNHATLSAPDLICFSHLRWDFVFQRPQHLLSRFATKGRVFFIEEPVFVDGPLQLNVSQRDFGLHVVVPQLPNEPASSELNSIQRRLVNQLFTDYNIKNYFAWYYTPMMLSWTDHLEPLATVYDCMDELSAFKGASPVLKEQEQELFRRADLVFTGGQSLYEAKREQHPRVYAFPSSIDVNHFAQALDATADTEDQANIPHPRIGYFGVIDERLDTGLLDQAARLRPDWHFIMIGPVVKIDPAELPQRENIHYLGGKQYAELPSYIAGWDAAMMPFALNESTRFISPTKTPEYLAAGRPVVSTPIQDVVRPYGEKGLAHIARTPEEFVTAIEAAIVEDGTERQRKVNDFLANTSWDKTWQQMTELINEVITKRQATNPSEENTNSAEKQNAVA